MGLEQIMLLKRSTVNYYIDGRKAFSHNISRSAQTLLQLPPGTHELVITYDERGIENLGMKMTTHKDTYRFILTSGKTAQINTTVGLMANQYSPGGHGGRIPVAGPVVEDHEGFESFEEIETE